MPQEHSPDSNLDRRLLRLEEAAGFTDRAVEQLSSEVVELNRRLRDLHQRTDALERRLTGVVEQLEEQDDEPA